MNTDIRLRLLPKLMAPVLGSLLPGVTGVTTEALAQERISIDAALNTWDGGTVPSELYGFRSSSEALEAVKCVLEAVGGLRVDNFEVRAANVRNAAAAIRGNTRLLLYNPSFMQDIREATDNPWAGISVMAHEIGHHLEAHTITPGGSNPSDELEADEFSGNVLKRLGASLRDAQAVFRTFSSRGSSTHPPRDARLTAVANGWDRADAPAADARIRDCFRPTASAPPATMRRQPSPPPPGPAIDFGDDSGRYAHDDSCDDNRFTGDPPWYYHWEGGSFNMTDATDCRTLLGEGLIRLRAPRSPPSGERRISINFGDDSGEWAHDGACDDNRFVGDSPWYYHWESGRHNMTDATDCLTLFQAVHRSVGVLLPLGRRRVQHARRVGLPEPPGCRTHRAADAALMALQQEVRVGPAACGGFGARSGLTTPTASGRPPRGCGASSATTPTNPPTCFLVVVT